MTRLAPIVDIYLDGVLTLADHLDVDVVFCRNISPAMCPQNRTCLPPNTENIFPAIPTMFFICLPTRLTIAIP